MTASYTTQCSANKCAAEGLAIAMEYLLDAVIVRIGKIGVKQIFDKIIFSSTNQKFHTIVISGPALLIVTH